MCLDKGQDTYFECRLCSLDNPSLQDIQGDILDMGHLDTLEDIRKERIGLQLDSVHLLRMMMADMGLVVARV